MTDQELDRMLRRALLDAADQEAQTPPETEVPLSEGHRRRMREMLRDPLLWFRLRNPYPWRTVARRAAVVLWVWWTTKAASARSWLRDWPQPSPTLPEANSTI